MSEFTRRQSTVLSGAPVVASARLVELIEWSAREVPNPLTLLVTSGGDDVQLRLTERLRVLPGRRLVCRPP